MRVLTFLYEMILPRFGVSEYATTILSILVSLMALFLILEIWLWYFFRFFFLEFAMVFKVLHVVRVLSNVE